MKKFTLISRLGIAAALPFALLSCGEKESPFIGSWQSTTPVSVTRTMPGVTSAIETVLLDFISDRQSTDGQVTLRGRYDIVCPARVAGADSCTLSFTAVAAVNGSWTHDVDDHDDLLLDFDYSSVTVAIDSASVKKTPDIPISPSAGDSLLQIMKTGIDTSFRESLTRMSVMEDVKVSKDGRSMTLEVKNPDYDLRFKRIEM